MPLRPLFTSMAVFSLGLVVCGTAPTMEVLVLGRVLQGLGSGAMVVAIYVVVGLIYPAALRPAIFASFAAAWVLPALFGPALAALVAATVGWRWVFLGMVALVALAAVLVAPSLRSLPTPESPRPASRVQLWWALLAAAAVLSLELLGSGSGLTLLAAAGAFVLVIVGLRPLLPAGALVARRGLPAVIVTRGLLSAAFFCAEAYIVYALQERWDLTPGQAGIALTCVGVVWAASSQVSSRLGNQVTNVAAMKFGTAVVLAGVTGVAVVVLLRSRGVDLPAVAPMAAYVFASVGMGFAYPRTSVAMLAVTTDADRGFNSSALSVADSLGAALALSLSGIAYAVAVRADVDPFPVVYAIAVGIGVLGRAGGPAYGRSLGVVPAADGRPSTVAPDHGCSPTRSPPQTPRRGTSPRVPRSAAAQCGVHERRRCVTAVGLVERRTGRHDLVDPVEHVRRSGRPSPRRAATRAARGCAGR